MFDPKTELAGNHVHSFNPTEHPNDSYDSWGTMNFDPTARKTPQNYENHRNWNGEGVQFRPENMEDETGVCSPPLWRTSQPTSPVHTCHPQKNYRYLSPNSKAQAIARGQWELMEMMNNMPESCYDLSLKDIVEHPTRLEPQAEECLVDEKKFGRVKEIKRQGSKKSEKKEKMMRSRSTDNGGLLIKVVFPISFGSKKKKKNSDSPKPEASDKSFTAVGKEWWKKRFTVSRESECGGRSRNSGSPGSSGSNRSRKSESLLGCWSIFLSKKNNKV
ncbi:hypothetical protein LOK49_LG05G02566 [Camellia lanceoleosa]|uniref:Uncharacterized protein n=1 Tax=Camellia lanceoleosa TaxID=1840588 RepID=A0ACC0HQ48_9ERIC|nr:hypothetical protein LOK49_LG05G02566 [Camellia lanceoleosa]